MNKVILIALIAVCVASSAQAFVRRDAPAAPAAEVNYLEKLKEGMDQVQEQLKKTFNPDDISKQFKEVVDSLSKSFDEFKKKAESKPEEAKP